MDAFLRLDAFLRGYDGGACFLARPLIDGGDPAVIQAISSDPSTLSRFDAAFAHEMGAGREIIDRVIAPAQCPALQLMKLSAAAPARTPRILMVNALAGTGRPLAGTVSGIAGRRLAIIALDNDGAAHRLRFKMAPGGDEATFSVALSGDADSIGPLQLLLAIVSDSPLAAVESFKSGTASDLASKLSAGWSSAAASAEVAFFQVTK